MRCTPVDHGPYCRAGLNDAKRKIREWDILYRKYYNGEVKKLGIQYNPVAYGTLGTMTTSGNDFDIPYSIPSAPYNQNLYVIVQSGPTFTPSHQTQTVQTGGPSPIVLTVAAPSVSGVDFRIVNVIVK